jgi:predicted alpha-1,2-mannosidase
VAVASALVAPAARADLAAQADPMVGTFAPGFVFPGAATPFGMVQNSPDTRGPFAYAGYLWTDPAIQGFSLVHLSGPGVKKAGDLPFMPTTGAVTTQAPLQIQSPFDHATETAEPGYYSVLLARYATRVELTASEHAAMQRYTFRPAEMANVIINPGRGIDGVRPGHVRISGPDEVTGSTEGRYPVYFVARFDRPFTRRGVLRADGTDAAAWVGFDARSQRTVTARIGISFVDLAGARHNLEAEALGVGFDTMRAAARTAWNRALGAIEVQGANPLDSKTFYTALYHSLLHPNSFTDVDGRYLGFDGQPHLAAGRTQYANFSSWDTYKSQDQLVTLIEPGRYREMLLSLLDDFRQSGKLPRWGEQNLDASHMSGDPTFPMIADGLCRGLISTTEGQDLYEAAVATAARRPSELDQPGYLPIERFSSGAGTTLEYGVADFALALIARRLGHDAEAAAWLERSVRYRSLMDPSTHWVRPRHADGSWNAPFQPTDETGFQEGNSWHYSWLAPHDARGLFQRMGGTSVAASRLEHMFAVPPIVANATNVFGLVYRTPWYAPGNEMDLQVPWMNVFAGRPWQGAKALSDVRSTFRPTPDGLPGNDDLGGLSSWHVLSALGFGPVTPGAPFYVIGSPQFTQATVHLGAGRTLVIRAPGASPFKPYVTAARLNGHALGRAWFTHAEIANGGTLELTMGALPNKQWGASAAAAPPSASDSAGLAGFTC